MHSVLPKRNNFDHLRHFLALGVFLFHLAELSRHDAFSFFRTFISPAVAVHSFFIISGFLIFMSFERSSSVKRYLGKRFRRIAPGYIAVVLLCFLFLAPLSNLPLQAYYTSPESFRFLAANLSTLNFLHPTLPGVFEDNPIHAVNGALWTIKVEVLFYLSVPLIALAGRRWGMTRTLVLLFALSLLYTYTMETLAAKDPFYKLLAHQFPAQLLFFAAGALLYYHLEKFKRFATAALILAVAGFFTQKFFPALPLYALSLSLIVIYLAVVFPYMGHIARHGDLSYGIYIWHFPLIQSFVALGYFDTHPWLAFWILSLLVVLFSWLSWHLVEKPFLSRQSHYVAEEKRK